MGRRIAAIVTVVLALAVFAAAGYVILHNDPVHDAGKTPGFTSAPASPAGSGSASPSASGSASEPKIAFLGDNYTKGAGATMTSKGFVSLLGSKLHAQVKPFSVKGGGYAKGSDSGAYSDEIKSVVAEKPDMVVVTGGRNDVSDDPTTLTSKAASLFSDLHKQLPDAVLVAVAPFWGDSDAPSDLDMVATAVKKGVTAAKGKYLDISDPLNGHSSYMASASNPNDKGYAAIADALAPKLKDLLPKS